MFTLVIGSHVVLGADAGHPTAYPGRNDDRPFESLEQRWRSNKAELSRTTAADWLERELTANRIEEPEAVHDSIQLARGFEEQVGPESRRRSGLR